MTTKTANKAFYINGSMQTILMLEITEVNENIQSELTQHFNQAPKLFNQQPLIISIDQVNFQINGDYLKSIIRACKQANVNIIGVCGCHSLVSQEAVKAAELSEISPKKAPEKNTPSSPTTHSQTENPAETFKYGHVRSGQTIEAPGTLIVIGNISRGAEVIAGGSIHVYGALGGRAIAGSYGNTHATVIAQAFDPELVCIAGVYTTSEQSHFSSGELSIAKLENHAIEVTQI